jgi:selenocysteine lyase/cysteine desulfurase
MVVAVRLVAALISATRSRLKHFSLTETEHDSCLYFFPRINRKVGFLIRRWSRERSKNNANSHLETSFPHSDVSAMAFLIISCGANDIAVQIEASRTRVG